MGRLWATVDEMTSRPVSLPAASPAPTRRGSRPGCFPRSRHLPAPHGREWNPGSGAWESRKERQRATMTTSPMPTPRTEGDVLRVRVSCQERGEAGDRSTAVPWHCCPCAPFSPLAGHLELRPTHWLWGPKGDPRCREPLSLSSQLLGFSCQQDLGELPVNFSLWSPRCLSHGLRPPSLPCCGLDCLV